MDGAGEEAGAGETVDGGALGGGVRVVGRGVVAGGGARRGVLFERDPCELPKLLFSLAGVEGEGEEGSTKDAPLGCMGAAGVEASMSRAISR